MALLIEMAESVTGNPTQWMRPFYRAYKHIGVYKDSHLLAVWIEVFATQRLIGDGGRLGEAVRPLFKLSRPLLSAQARARRALNGVMG